MTRMLCFADAVTLLGGDNPTVAKLDKVLGGGIVVAGGAQAVLAVNVLKGAKYVIDHAPDLLRQLNERIGRANRHGRLELLVAAHTVVVVTAFYDAVEGCEPVSAYVKQVRGEPVARLSSSAPKGPGAAPEAIVRDQLLGLAVSGHAPRASHLDLVEALLYLELPPPSPEMSLAQTENSLGPIYALMTRRLQRFIKDLPEWNQLSGSRQTLILEALENTVQQSALDHYRRRLRELAVLRPEFLIWTTLNELDAAAHERIHAGRALDRLEAQLGQLTSAAGQPGRLGLTLARAYRAQLSSPMLPVDESQLPQGLNAPTLGEGYIDPAFRVASITAQSHPADDRWWDEHAPLRQDLAGFLAGYLVTARATTTPLIVLGHPGAGKSLLTRVFAARLPETAALPVRVELRSVNADDSIREQIESAVYQTTGRRHSWAQVADEAVQAGAVPVILFDGFDELLQATGKSQSDFLKRIEEFQHQEAIQERPVAVAVTTRTVVASQTTFPHHCVAIRLETFDEQRIRSWVGMWNRINADFFVGSPSAPLDVDAVLSRKGLSEQPLLLFMLALFDASTEPGAGLRGYGSGLSPAQLYEALLLRFVHREVDKDPSSQRISSEAFAKRAEGDFERLAVVAFGAFNRNAKSVVNRQLDADLRCLTGRRDGDDPLDQTHGQLTVGRFFFVHESLAQLNPADGTLHSYEFVHSTFGEYLVARKAFRTLMRLAKLREMTAVLGGRPVDTGDDEALLFALLSFAPLSDIPQIVEFVCQMAQEYPLETRNRLATIAHMLFRTSHSAKVLGRYGDYQPTRANIVNRHVVYSLNILILNLAVRASDRCMLTELFDQDDPALAAAQWAQAAQMWRAQLVPASWEALIKLTAVGSVQPEASAGGESATEPGVWLKSRRAVHPESEPAAKALERGPSIVSARSGRLQTATVTSEYLMDRDLQALTDVAATMAEVGVSFDYDVSYRSTDPGGAPHRPEQSLAVVIARLRRGPLADPGTVERDMRALLSALEVSDPALCEQLVPEAMGLLREHMFRLPRDLVEKALTWFDSNTSGTESDSVQYASARLATWLAGVNSAWFDLHQKTIKHAIALLERHAGDGAEERLRLLLAVLDTGVAGLPLLGVASGVLKQIDLPALAEKDPQLFIGAFRIAAAAGCRDWLAKQGYDALFSAHQSVLLRFPAPVIEAVYTARYDRRRVDKGKDELIAHRIGAYLRSTWPWIEDSSKQSAESALRAQAPTVWRDSASYTG